ncbi:hypothetical protein ACJIZ3_003648 [Penstemon smallii]|uniref:Integrase catalytic domain-containing protein n=1 Tax=Penstemon smallii TaxID=265156 RepID=A0ABD3UA63_9LAMI
MDLIYPFNTSATVSYPHPLANIISLLFYHVPTITKNLVYVLNFCIDNDVYFEFHASHFCVKDSRTRTLLLHGRTKDGLYVFPSTSPFLDAFLADRVSPHQWHNRLGHPSMATVQRVIRQASLPIKGRKSDALCPACCVSKSHQLPHVSSLHRAEGPLHLIFADVWGPSPTLSRDGSRYYLSFVDDFSKYSWIFPLKRKSDVVDVFRLFKNKVECLFNSKIRMIQSDWGGEFRSLRKLLDSFGITHRIYYPYSHPQNGTVERKHRHIVEVGLALLSHASLPHKFWFDAFVTAVYLINRLPTPILGNKSPFEILFHKTPKYRFLKVFGCQCWPNLRPYNKHKMDPRSLPCVFLGYSPNHHGYLCLHLPTSRLYISRDVLFDETIFPFAPSYPKPTSPPNSNNFLLPLQFSTHSQPQNSPSNITTEPTTHPISTLDPPLNQPEAQSPPLHSNSHLHPISSNPHSPSIQTTTQNDPNNSSVSSSSPTTALVCASPPTRIITRSHTNTTRPKIRTDGTIPWPPPKAHLTTTANSVPDEPSSVTQAFDALMSTRTWTIVPPHFSQNLVGCKWVFKTKFLFDGTIERRKARLVAKGFNQVEGYDFTETFSPVVKPTTIRLVLSIAVSFNWSITQLDVQNAFLHGLLDESVYMAQPPGFVHPDFPNYVCKLNRAIYGLKQAPWAWYARLSSKLLELGFTTSRSDSSLFVYNHKSIVVYLLVYVDDILLTGSCSKVVDELISKLSIDFPVKNLGGLHYFLGIECSRTSLGLHISQRKYICDLLKRANMSSCKPVGSPMATSVKLYAFDSASFEDPTLYRSIVGSLQYLSFTRPDIAYSVNRVCQYMHAPCVSHWQSMKRILRYLKHTADHGLYFQPSFQPALVAYSDADWAGCLDDRKSTGGFCVFFGRNLVSWSAKKQSTIARSSTEAEYKALAIATCEILWLQSLLRDLRIFSSSPPVLYCDNLGATYLSKNPIMHSRTKHVDIDYHFVRDRVQTKALQVSFLSSKDQLADIFTKPLSIPRFTTLKTSLTVLPSPFGSRGRIEGSSTSNNSSKKPTQTKY